MKLIKMLSLAAMAALASMAFLGASSAMAESTALCKVKTSPCPEASILGAGTVIKAQLKEGTESVLLGPGSKVEVTCTASTSEGKTTTGLANPLKGEITSLKFEGCTREGIGCTVKVEKLGTLTLSFTAANEGQALETGVLVKIVCGIVFECAYTTESLPLTAKGTQENEEEVVVERATLKAQNAKLTQEGIGLACPSEGFFDATYEITAPEKGFITK